jgi:hypothetical protein
MRRSRSLNCPLVISVNFLLAVIGLLSSNVRCRHLQDRLQPACHRARYSVFRCILTQKTRCMPRMPSTSCLA